MRIARLLALGLTLLAASPLLAEEIAYGRDSNLVGHWRFTDTMTSDSGGLISEQHLVIRADGSYVLGDGRLAGGDDIEALERLDGDAVVAEGQWKTHDRVVYVQEGDEPWEPHARYGIQNTTLTLHFGDGSTEVWYRIGN